MRDHLQQQQNLMDHLQLMSKQQATERRLLATKRITKIYEAAGSGFASSGSSTTNNNNLINNPLGGGGGPSALRKIQAKTMMSQ